MALPDFDWPSALAKLAQDSDLVLKDLAVKIEAFGDSVRTNVQLARVGSVRSIQRAKGWTHEHDKEQGPKHLVELATGYLHSSEQREVDSKKFEEEVLAAAALLVAALEVIEATRGTYGEDSDAPHD